MKRNVLFFLYDQDAEEYWRDRTGNWTPLTGFCLNTELPLHRIHVLYWQHDKDKALKLGEVVAGINTALDVQYIEIPYSSDMIRHLSDFMYDFAVNYPLSTNESYYFYTQGPQMFFRVYLYYLATKKMLTAHVLEILPPSGRVPWPGKVTICYTDMGIYEEFAQVLESKRGESLNFLKYGIATHNPAYNAIITNIEFVAVQSQDPILILGPTGSGKSALVRQIYKLKQKRQNLSGPFCEINCGSVRGDAALSTLFGHVRGAFTGAVGNREGLLKAAHNGLLFLDEVGLLGLEEQALLLTALEEKRFRPMGDDKEVHSNFQLICGTNIDLGAELENGSFRSDLYARINVWTFTLPGLAERREDIEPNLNYELSRYQSRTGHLVVFSTAARARYLDFATSSEALWQGNFRDLNSSCARMALFAVTSGVITLENVNMEIERLAALWRKRRPDAASAVSPGNPAPAPGSLFPLPVATRPDAHAHSLQNYRLVCPHVVRLLNTEILEKTDLFDLYQLEKVLTICQISPTLAAAGRTLFNKSRKSRTTMNDTDRIRKFLKRFQLTWEAIHNEPVL